jgi:hypothetical protein
MLKKPLLLYFLLGSLSLHNLFAQDTEVLERDAIISLIDEYSKAREFQDTILLKRILMPNIDQLVSSGERRTGIDAAVEGMLRSSNTNQGTRTLTVEKIKFLNPQVALADAKYEIRSESGSIRNMWSSFIVVRTEAGWKISGIRNMLPAR